MWFFLIPCSILLFDNEVIGLEKEHFWNVRITTYCTSQDSAIFWNSLGSKVMWFPIGCVSLALLAPLSPLAKVDTAYKAQCWKVINQSKPVFVWNWRISVSTLHAYQFAVSYDIVRMPLRWYPTSSLWKATKIRLYCNQMMQRQSSLAINTVTLC